MVKESATASLMPGDPLDDDLTVVYHLGGTRKVDLYLCNSEIYQDIVACKVLTPRYRDRRSAIEALRQEGEILQRFKHDHVAEGYAINLDELPHIVMEYLEGQNLSTTFLSGNFDAFEISEIVRVIGHVATGLDYVHQQGVLHLDVKPSNVMYLDGHATLFDFSVAEPFTRGEIMISNAGTTEYMAPEQTYTKLLGYSTDVYGLGATAYRLLTGGEYPYPEARSEEGDDKDECDYSITPTHPSRLNRRVPKPLGDVILTAISPDPTDRFDTPMEFREALYDASQMGRIDVPDTEESAAYESGRRLGEGLFRSLGQAVRRFQGSLQSVTLP